MFGLHPGDHALVVAPHPDDETLGPGGTIAALTAHGVTVHVLAVACTTLPMFGGASEAITRMAEFDNACTVLGVVERHIAWIDDDGARDPGAHLVELIALLESGQGPSLASVRPQALLLPAQEAHHQDHQAVHTAGIAAARPGDRRQRPIPRIVLGYDGPEDRAWCAVGAPRPLLVNTSTVWAIKDKALRCYDSQLRDEPHPRSLATIRSLDSATGAGAGHTTAERFAIYRMEV